MKIVQVPIASVCLVGFFVACGSGQDDAAGETGGSRASEPEAGGEGGGQNIRGALEDSGTKTSTGGRIGKGGNSGNSDKSGRGGAAGSGAHQAGGQGDGGKGGGSGKAGSVLQGSGGRQRPDAGHAGAEGMGGNTTGAAGAIPSGDAGTYAAKLVTSGRDSYWKEGQWTEVTSGNADLSVNEGTTYQDWSGFGGTFNEAGWDVLSLLDPAEKDRALRLLFGSEGTRFVYGRIPIGASDYALDRYTLDDTPDDYEMEQFSIDRDKKMLIPFIRAALDVRPDLYLWASPWSPPAWMKDNNSINNGNMKSDATILQAHALYLAKFVEAYADEGLTIRAIAPQNEPGYGLNYPSCVWTPDLFKTYVGTYLGPTFEKRNITAAILCGTLSAPNDGKIADAVLSDPTASKYVAMAGGQWNQVSNAAGWISKYNVTVWQTEHKCGNYPWDAKYNANKPPNDHDYAVESWGLLRDWIKAGVSAYSAWNMVLDTNGKNIDAKQPWPQNALMTVDRSTKTLTITPAYHVFRHFGQFIEAGAKRVGTTGSAADALAFKNPDGSIVTVIYNSGAAKKITLAVGGTKLQFEIPANGWATVKH